MIVTFRSLAYLAASLLFILSLRGLSTQETALHGNRYGVVGMATKGNSLSAGLSEWGNLLHPSEWENAWNETSTGNTKSL